MSCGGKHPNRKTHHKHLSAEQKKKISAALKGKKHPHKGHRLDLATRRKISESLRCRAAERGTCYKRKPETAHRIEARLIKKLHQNPAKQKKCPAPKEHRHSKGKDRRNAHIHRHVMHHVRRDQRQHRRENTPRWVHLVHTLPAKRGRRLLHLERAWRRRERAIHKARVHCHVAHRKAGPKIKKRPQCPHGRKRVYRSRIK